MKSLIPGLGNGAALALSIVLSSGVVAAGCGSNVPTAAPSASGSAAASSLASPVSSAPPLSLPSSPGPDASASDTAQSLPPGVTVDPGLLEVLPADVDGVTLEPDAATAAQIGSDPLLAESARSLAVALAAAPGASGEEDLAVASVIRLLPDVFDEAFYQEWRDTYNEAACQVADGVEAEDETEIGGRQVYTGTCVGGARTYHTYLVDQGFIVSITDTGQRRLGEQIMADLAG